MPSSADLLEVYGQIRRNCDAWEATLPPPAEAFRARVDELLKEAHRGALLAMPNATVVYVRERYGELQVVRRSAGCVGCGCEFDDRTKGCRPCRTRHAVRAHAARLAAAA